VWLQAASLVGALLILAAYAAHQAGRIDRDTVAYNLINAAGALLLLLGFILLEGTWTAISLVALRRPRRSAPSR
jgi:hypothetical protein